MGHENFHAADRIAKGLWVDTVAAITVTVSGYDVKRDVRIFF
jgi:hypothetical protein